MIIIQNVELYTPEYNGTKDVFIASGKFVAIRNRIETSDLKQFDVRVIDGTGFKLVPGIIDPHVHISGAGGEGGPATRTPEIPLRDLLE